ncbi:aspartate--tRNA ligase [Candidatus Gottesmanbacteria bacterium]|nr:aspartate--tRNA ligase [Candidatus Gottesmanbacteria bacterium]
MEKNRTLIIETSKKVGQEITLYGWIATRRSHGKITFFDLRDRSGIVQLVDAKGVVSSRDEDVVEVKGVVRQRPPAMVNPKISTGEVEVEVYSVLCLSKAKELPFQIDTDGYDINEEVRLRFRYLDLRRKRLARNLQVRSAFVRNVREFFTKNDFVEVETPLLTKSTPEGSRDFLVPSRLQKGKFYALPQSPQQYKQLLMTAGFERYFQIARCLRDEDLRADRGFEHTQIDVEMSFVDREDVMNILEEMMITVCEAMGKTIQQKPFPVYTYNQAIEKFGADKFDLRTQKEKEDKNVLAFSWVVDFPFFEKDKEGKWTFTHNPFSKPNDEYIEDVLMKRNIGKILTSQYDLVCNGFEVGGGSIRSHKKELLEAVFEILGYSRTQIHNEFGHMLEAFSFGTPPHGGCAFGVDRLVMILTNEINLREVVAFPTTSQGQASVMDAPSLVSQEQLKELGIKLV